MNRSTPGVSRGACPCVKTSSGLTVGRVPRLDALRSIRAGVLGHAIVVLLAAVSLFLAIALLVVRGLVGSYGGFLDGAGGAGGWAEGWLKPHVSPWIERLSDVGFEVDQFRVGWAGWDPVLEADVVRWSPPAAQPAIESPDAIVGGFGNRATDDGRHDSGEARGRGLGSEHGVALESVTVDRLWLRVDLLATLASRSLVVMAIELDGLQTLTRGDLPSEGWLAALLAPGDGDWLTWALPEAAWSSLRRFALDEMGVSPQRLVISDLRIEHRGQWGDETIREHVVVDRFVAIRDRVAGVPRTAMRVDAQWLSSARLPGRLPHDLPGVAVVGAQFEADAATSRAAPSVIDLEPAATPDAGTEERVGGERSGLHPRLNFRLRLSFDANERFDADLRVSSSAPAAAWRDWLTYAAAETVGAEPSARDNDVIGGLLSGPPKGAPDQGPGPRVASLVSARSAVPEQGTAGPTGWRLDVFVRWNARALERVQASLDQTHPGALAQRWRLRVIAPEWGAGGERADGCQVAAATVADGKTDSSFWAAMPKLVEWVGEGGRQPGDRYASLQPRLRASCSAGRAQFELADFDLGALSHDLSRLISFVDQVPALSSFLVRELSRAVSEPGNTRDDLTPESTLNPQYEPFVKALVESLIEGARQDPHSVDEASSRSRFAMSGRIEHAGLKLGAAPASLPAERAVTHQDDGHVALAENPVVSPEAPSRDQSGRGEGMNLASGQTPFDDWLAERAHALLRSGFEGAWLSATDVAMSVGVRDADRFENVGGGSGLRDALVLNGGLPGVSASVGWGFDDLDVEASLAPQDWATGVTGLIAFVSSRTSGAQVVWPQQFADALEVTSAQADVVAEWSPPARVQHGAGGWTRNQVADRAERAERRTDKRECLQDGRLYDARLNTDCSDDGPGGSNGFEDRDFGAEYAAGGDEPVAVHRSDGGVVRSWSPDESSPVNASPVFGESAADDGDAFRDREHFSGWRVHASRLHWRSSDGSMIGQVSARSFPMAEAVIDSAGEARIGRGSVSDESAGGGEPANGRSPGLGLWAVDLTIEAFDVAAVPRYLPRAMPPMTASWLRRALRHGEVVGGRVRFSGDPVVWAETLGRRTDLALARGVDSEPNSSQRFEAFHRWSDEQLARQAGRHLPGRLTVRVPFNDVTLDYRDRWPAAKAVDGLLTIDDERLRVEATSGRLGSGDDAVMASDVSAVIENMIVAPQLSIDGLLAGSAERVWSVLESNGTVASIGADDLELGFSGDIEGRLRIDAALDEANPLPPLSTRSDGGVFGARVMPSDAVGGREVRVTADVRLRGGRVDVGVADLRFESVDARFVARPDGGLSIVAGRGSLFGETLVLVSPEFGETPEGGVDQWLGARLEEPLVRFAVTRARSSGSTRIRFSGRQRLNDWWEQIPVEARPVVTAAFGEQVKMRPLQTRATLAFPFELADGPPREGGGETVKAGGPPNRHSRRDSSRDDARERPWGLAVDLDWSDEDWRLPLPPPPAGSQMSLRYAAAGVARDSSGRLLPATDASQRVDAQLRLQAAERFDLQLRLADTASVASSPLAGARLILLDDPVRELLSAKDSTGLDARVDMDERSERLRGPLGAGEWQLFGADLDIDAWLDWGRSALAPVEGGPTEVNLRPSPRAGAEGALPLRSVRIDVTRNLTWLGRDWGNVQVDLVPGAAARLVSGDEPAERTPSTSGTASAQGSRSRYRIRLSGTRLAGDLNLDLPMTAAGVDLGRVASWRVFGRLSRLWMPLQADATASDLRREAPVVSGPETSGGSTQLPEMALSIDDLRVGELRVVNVELTGQSSSELRPPNGTGTSAETSGPLALTDAKRVENARRSAVRPVESTGLWRLERVRARLPNGDVELIADGWTWTDVERGVASSVRVRLVGEDWGGAVAAARLTDALAAGSGEAVVEASWSGPLWAPERRSLAGGFELELSDGSLRAIEPGAGRLLGLVSLDALSSRLRLDFRDVFDRGFAFRRMAGVGRMEAGVVEVESLGIVGPAAAVRISGQADLVSGALDQRVFVVPALRTGIPVLGAIIGGPLGALAGLVADRALNLGAVIEEAARLEYRVSGVMADPVIEAVTVE